VTPCISKNENDVLVEGAIVFELVGEVENDVGLESVNFLLEQIEVVKDREVFGGMAEFSQGREHVGLGFSSLRSSTPASDPGQLLWALWRRQGEDFESFSSRLLRALELAGEQVIHYQRRDVGGHRQILLRVIGFDLQVQFIAARDQACEQFG